VIEGSFEMLTVISYSDFSRRQQSSSLCHTENRFAAGYRKYPLHEGAGQMDSLSACPHG